MKAGILAAGDGSRLAADGIATPKPLVKVGGMSLIERTMRALVDAGVDEIVFLVNQRMASVGDAVKSFRLPVPVHGVIQTTPSSMHSLHALSPWLCNERFVLCTVDSVLRGDEFRGFIHAYAAHPERDILLSYTDFVDDENPLRIGLAKDERVLALGPAAATSPFVTLGLYGMTPSVFPVLDHAVAAGEQRLRNFLARLLASELQVFGHRISKGIDVDRPHDITVAEAFLLESSS
jgi:NDP-sugar pyrophosphorylase family protein